MSGSTVTTGTKYDYLDITTSAFGEAVDIVYGTHKISGNCIDYIDFTVVTTSTTSGKGGVTTDSYTYEVAAAIGLCEGEIGGIGRIWDSSTAYEKHAISSDWSVDSATLAAIKALYYDSDGDALDTEDDLSVFYGTATQSPWSYMTSKHNGTITVTATGSGKVLASNSYQLTISLASTSYTFSSITEVYYYDDGDEVTLDSSDYSFNSSTLTFTFGSAYANKTVYYTYKYTYYSLSSNHALVYPYLAYVAGYISLGSSNYLTSYGFEVFGKNIYGSGNLDCEPYLIIKGLLTDDVFGINFPTDYLGSFTNYQNYCLATGIFLSIAIDSQSETSEILNNIIKATNSQPVTSQGTLKLVPYGTSTITGNGATYTPDLDPIYSLTDTDFIYDSDDPVKLGTDDTSDIFNFQQLTFKNRSDEYADDVISCEDLASIDDIGLKKADSVSLDCVTTSAVAAIVVENIAERTIYHRNQYTFKTPYFPFILLDPMDLIEITDEFLGLDCELVRIISMDVDSDKLIEFTVEEVGITNSGTVEYTRQEAVRASSNTATSPGDVNTPIIFEPPAELGGGYEVWAAVSGANSNWGGCYVYLSTDGETYEKKGTITSRARMGVLTATLATGDDPDTTNSIKVNLTESLGELSSGTQDDADNYSTLCYVDGELISYETATLTATYKYTLGTYLRRGVYGTTIAEHASSSDFLRIDEDRFFQYTFTEDNIGETIYIKFCSFNIYGSSVESLANATEYTYTVTGSAMYSALDDVTNLSISYSNNQAVLSWDAVTDFRSPIYYEIRKGDTFSEAQVLGRVSTTSYTLQSTGTYWIAAVFQKTYNSKTYIAYSADWEEIECTLATIATNEISSIDEAGTDWSGTCSGGAEIQDNILCLGSDSYIDDMTVNVDTIDDWDEYGGIATSGIYTIPTDHIFHVDEDQAITFTASYDVSVVLENGDFDDVTSVDALSYWDNEDPNYGSATVQINVALVDGTYTGWQDFTPGQYYGSYFNFRIVLATTSSEYNVYVSSFIVSATVDTRYETGNVTVPTAGLTVTYTKKFNNVPKPSITIFDAEEGDTVKLTSQTSSGFTVALTNNGTAVSRSINWTSIGY